MGESSTLAGASATGKRTLGGLTRVSRGNTKQERVSLVPPQGKTGFAVWARSGLDFCPPWPKQRRGGAKITRDLLRPAKTSQAASSPPPSTQALSREPPGAAGDASTRTRPGVHTARPIPHFCCFLTGS